jgi:hypothetical protein
MLSLACYQNRFPEMIFTPPSATTTSYHCNPRSARSITLLF